MNPISNDRAGGRSPLRTLLVLPACLLACLACADPLEEEIPLEEAGPQLGGTSWLVREYADGTGYLTSVEPGVELYATFTVDGRVAGFAGCNDFLGSFATDGAHITIRFNVVTDAICEGEGMMRRESAYLAALRNAATWEIRDGQLVMQKRDGTPVLVCSARRLPALPEASAPTPLGTSR